jgi:hypothetical protein
MTSDRQIAANRRNAANSSGPRTAAGKRRSRANALQHGLTAQTIIPGIEDAKSYRNLEAALISDFNPCSAVERQLVLRLASLLWRLQRASVIETGLFEIQGRFLQQRRSQEQEGDVEAGALRVFYRILHQPHQAHANANETARLLSAGAIAGTGQPHPHSDMSLAFLRLCKFNGEAIEHLGRYEVALWRQTVQVLLMLKPLSSALPGGMPKPPPLE